ncbi:hypothetical protein ARMGADRAFT_755301 [Armillaria gallica]|uniref:Uncharacterized protein n=1 Tax=Armillaria gallica TaxID=47427 RepID=A0A2H3E3Q4_ARMGA|nr:hypothetical protein ARMGADRAFT_755301 [Armillaria gallica]
MAMANACTTFVGLSGSSAGRCQSELRIIAYGSSRTSTGACLSCVTCDICAVNISIPVKPAAEQPGIPRSLGYVYFAQSPSRPVHISSKYLPSCHRWANIGKRSAWWLYAPRRVAYSSISLVRDHECSSTCHAQL